MRVTESTLRRYIRQVLQERVFGAQAFVYHGSFLEPAKFTEIMKSNQFEPGRGAGGAYGKGLYTVYEEDPNSNTFDGSYGRYVYKLKVNLSGFLIFDPDVCVKVHGKKMSLKDQLFQVGLKSAYATMKNLWDTPGWSDELQFSTTVGRRRDASGRLLAVTFEDVFDSEDFTDVFDDYTSKLAMKVSSIVRNRCAGLVFTGATDGNVCVIYDPSGVVVMGYQDVDKVGLSDEDRMKFEPVAPSPEEIRRSGTVTPVPGRYMPSQRIGTKALYATLKKNGIEFDRSRLVKVEEWMPLDKKIGASVWNWPAAVRDLLIVSSDRNAFTPKLSRDEIEKLSKEAWELAKEMMSKETM